MTLYDSLEDDSIVGENSSHDQYIIKAGKDFYRLDSATFNSVIGKECLIYKREIHENIIYTLAMFFSLIFVIILYLHSGLYTVVDGNFWVASVLLLINIPIHEFGHVLLLKLFYPSAKFSVGFKFLFIYPAFYVDTSDSYLLPKYKKIAVYLAGNFTNSIFLLIIYLFCPYLLPYCYLIVSNILINFIPIVKSDGYYAFMTFINRFQFAKSLKCSLADDFVRGLLMFVFLELIAYIL